MALSSIEAVDLLRFAEQFAERLAAATAELSQKRGHEREKGWMEAALAVVDEARRPAAGLLERARGLPELSELRLEFAAALQNAWVDALEKLVAGITFHVSSRSPVIEALFPHQKLPALRKAPREVVEKFQKDFEKRLRTSYVSRMLATEDFAFAGPVIGNIAKAWSEYIQSFSTEGLPPGEAAPIRRELIEGAEAVDQAIRQARLIAEAALLPMRGAFEASGLAMKPKKRAKTATPVEGEPPSLDDAVSATGSADIVAPAHDDARGGDTAETGHDVRENPSADAGASATAQPNADARASRHPPADAEAEAASDARSSAGVRENGEDVQAGTGADASTGRDERYGAAAQRGGEAPARADAQPGAAADARTNRHARWGAAAERSGETPAGEDAQPGAAADARTGRHARVGTGARGSTDTLTVGDERTDGSSRPDADDARAETGVRAGGATGAGAQTGTASKKRGRRKKAADAGEPIDPSGPTER
ncbi:MAG: hypothetical protein IRZ16_03460 [Myxococcaceae bacterium]|nr:hypothetical protein [Myxococcaceae bacterium]